VTTAVPTIDLDRDSAIVGSDLDAVCRDVGFFQIVNHAFPPDIADAAWSAATAFFDLPLEERMSVARPSGEYPYGYIPMAEETLARSVDTDGAPDLKEVFNVGPIDLPGHHRGARRSIASRRQYGWRNGLSLYSSAVGRS